MRGISLHQPVTEHAQQVAVVQVHLGQVRQHAQCQVALTLLQQQVGHVEEERAAVGMRIALGQVAVIQLRRRALAQAPGDGRVRLPGRQLDTELALVGGSGRSDTATSDRN